MSDIWLNQLNDCASSEYPDKPWHAPSLIRVFAVRMNKHWVLSYPLSALRRLWTDWADAHADLSLHWAHSHFVGFVMRRLISFSNSKRNQTAEARWARPKTEHRTPNNVIGSFNAGAFIKSASLWNKRLTSVRIKLSCCLLFKQDTEPLHNTKYIAKCRFQFRRNNGGRWW